MKCDEFEERISFFIDGELEQEEVEECSRHIEICNKCRTLWKKYASLDTLIKSIPEEPPEAIKPIDVMAPGRAILSPLLLKSAFSGFVVIIIALCITLILVKNLFDGRLSESPAVPFTRYDISLNDSNYYITVSGKEVKLLTFELTENDETGITMSFENQEKEEHHEKEDSCNTSCLIAFMHRDCQRGRET